MSGRVLRQKVLVLLNHHEEEIYSMIITPKWTFRKREIHFHYVKSLRYQYLYVVVDSLVTQS